MKTIRIEKKLFQGPWLINFYQKIISKRNDFQDDLPTEPLYPRHIINDVEYVELYGPLDGLDFSGNLILVGNGANYGESIILNLRNAENKFYFEKMMDWKITVLSKFPQSLFCSNMNQTVISSDSFNNSIKMLISNI